MKKTLLIGAIALLGLAGGIGLNLWLNRPAPGGPDDVAGQREPLRPAFVLQDTEDQPRDVQEWDGKVIMINFWATWCPPCRREMPALMKLYENYRDQGFVIVGVALDEKQNVIDYIDPMGVEYPVLIGDQKGIALTQAYGNRLGVLPYTVVIDRQGRIVSRHRNEITYEQAERMIKPLL